MHIRIFDVAHEVPIGDLSTTNPSVLPKDQSSTKDSSVEIEVPEAERETFDLWLRKLWETKDKDMAGYLQSGSFVNDSNLRIEVPLALKKRREAMDAFCFFIPALLAYLLSKLR